MKAYSVIRRLLSSMTYKDINLFECPEDHKIGEIYSKLREVSSLDIEFPLAVRLLENPKFKFFNRNLGIFPGAVDGTKHDYIHILLGRSFLPMDEAFVVGFCMGSTQKMSNLKVQLFNILAGAIYPKFYRFSECEKMLFTNAVEFGARHANEDLSEISKLEFSELTVKQARFNLISDWSDVKRAYKSEALQFPDHKSSTRIYEYLGRV